MRRKGCDEREKMGNRRIDRVRKKRVGCDVGVWKRGAKREEVPSLVPLGVIGSWTANLSQLNQQQQR